MHPFTSLTLWALAACTTLLLPAQTVLPVYSAATFLCLLALKSTRRRAKYVAWLMLSLGVGLWLVHGGWLTEISRRTQAALQLCQLMDVAEAHPLDLHAAQRRMVAVASLEAMAPPVLLLDEPSRDFDAHWLTVFEHWLATCRARGTIVAAISHDAAFTRRHFSRVVRLHNGTLSPLNVVKSEPTGIRR